MIKKFIQTLGLVIALAFFASSFFVSSTNAACSDSVVGCSYGIFSSNTLCQFDSDCSNCSSLPYSGCCQKKFGKCKVNYDNWETLTCKSPCSSSTSGGGNACGCDTGICPECPTN